MTSPAPGVPPQPRLHDLGEDEILARILPLLGTVRSADVLVGPGDDAAVVAAPQPLVVTTDSMVRERDWRDDWSSPRDVARKLGAQNVSDIAAMGGTATAALLTVAADPSTPLAWVESFAAGLGEWCAEAGVALVGGDLSSAPVGVVHVSLTMWGGLGGRDPVLRSGARPGDLIAVCGSLGWSGAGLASFVAGDPDVTLGPDSPMTDRLREVWRWYHRQPRPPWESGPVAAVGGATSMIDISDGLVRDAGRVARASGVGFDLDRSALESDFVSSFSGVLSRDEAWRHVLGGGEEHSLLATFPPERGAPQSEESPWWVIGSVGPGEGVTLDGEPLDVVGWDHFRQR